MLTGAVLSWRGVGVSPAPSNVGSLARGSVGSGEADPWLEKSAYFGDGGVYTLRVGKKADVEAGDCGT